MHAISSSKVFELKDAYSKRLLEAQRTAATAPLASVWQLVLDELTAADDGTGNGANSQPSERLLTADEAGVRLGLSRKQVYNRAGDWPFTRRLGSGTLRFSQQGLERWLTQRGRKT